MVFLWKEEMLPGSPLGGSGDLLRNRERLTAPFTSEIPFCPISQWCTVKISHSIDEMDNLIRHLWWLKFGCLFAHAHWDYHWSYQWGLFAQSVCQQLIESWFCTVLPVRIHASQHFSLWTLGHVLFFLPWHYRDFSAAFFKVKVRVL